MKFLLLTFSLGITFLLCSCGGSGHFSRPSVHPDFKPALERLKQEAQSRGVEIESTKLTVRYEETDNRNAAAECHPLGPLIKVSPAYAERPQSHKDLILLHEVGHCLFRLPHVASRERIMGPGDFTEDIKRDPWQPKYLDLYFDYILSTRNAPKK